MYYLDEAATTQPLREVVARYNYIANEYWFNANSTYAINSYESKIIKEAEDAIKEYLDCDDIKVIFTGSGSEANNLIKYCVTTEIEHKSNLNTTLDVPLAYGNLLKDFCRVHGCRYSIMAVNNETGECFLDTIKDIGKQYMFHSDCTQCFSNRQLTQEIFALVNCITVSFHKVGGLKGLGALIMHKDYPMYINTRGLGTPNTAAIATVPLVVERLIESKPNPFPLETLLRTFKSTDSERFKKHKMRILQEEKFDEYKHEFVPYIRNIRFEGVHGETLVSILAKLGVYCSTGSACSHGKESYVLKAMGLSDEEVHGYIRLSSHQPIDEYDAEQIVKIFEQALEIYDEIHSS